MQSSTRLGFVIVDILDGQMLDSLYERRASRLARFVSAATRTRSPAWPMARSATIASRCSGAASPCSTPGWETGAASRDDLEHLRAARSLRKLADAQSAQVGGCRPGQAILLILTIVAFLFLIIEFVALVMGLALARSITSSIHELFMGTERVRHGDFTHRINIMTNDQLGELAGSFNQMIGSIENLLQTAADKKRLEEELRIARQIQMSLLPRRPLDVPGSPSRGCACPRVVGGDYYDFFKLPGDLLGVLIADVSGKGTSAALYMAELKGLVLSLSQIYLSPRQLLVEVNRISDNLDTRSFITMTYAVIDLKAGRMTYARAGHTPLIFMRSGSGTTRPVKVLVRAAWWSACAFPAPTRSSWNLSRRSRRSDQRRRDRALHRRHQRSDERRSDLFGTRASAGSSRSTGTWSRARLGRISPRDRGVRRRSRSARRHDDDPDEGRAAVQPRSAGPGRSGAGLRPVDQTAGTHG